MKRILLALAFVAMGSLGAGAVLAAMHLWVDHQNLHALVEMVVAQQRAAAAKPPAGTN